MLVILNILNPLLHLVDPKRMKEQQPGSDATHVGKAPPLCNYRESRALAGGADVGTHLSPFFSLGCCSAGHVYREVTSEATRRFVPQEELDWLVMHLQV